MWYNLVLPLIHCLNSPLFSFEQDFRESLAYFITERLPALSLMLAFNIQLRYEGLWVFVLPTTQCFMHSSPFPRLCLSVTYVKYLCVWRDCYHSEGLFVLNRVSEREKNVAKLGKKKYSGRDKIPTGHFWLLGIQVAVLFSKWVAKRIFPVWLSSLPLHLCHTDFSFLSPI